MTKINGRRINGEGAINKVKGRDLYRMQIWVNEQGILNRKQVYQNLNIQKQILKILK